MSDNKYIIGYLIRFNTTVIYAYNVVNQYKSRIKPVMKFNFNTLNSIYNFLMVLLI